MPLSNKGRKIMRNMKNEYGAKKGKKVFYASKNKGKISGVDKLKQGARHAIIRERARKY